MFENKIYRETDVDPNFIADKTIAVVGYGAQGQAHALNLRDSGCNVVIGQKIGGRGWQESEADGFQPTLVSSAVRKADIVCLMVPDELHQSVFQNEILPNLKPGAIILTCHGFSFHYELVVPPAGCHRLLVAPKGQGHMVRGEFENGGGVPCLVAVDPGPDSDTVFRVGLAYAWAIGGTRAGVIPTTIAAETETDLFGEQAVLCGGLTQLIQAGFETLVSAGYQPELAYFECLHELKIIVDLLHSGGIASMRDLISTTAEYGDVTRGPKIIDEHVRENMRRLLDEIRSGAFAKEFLTECENNQSTIKEQRQVTEALAIEKVGAELRNMMPWLKQEA
ncbi:MAG: ketol-acid reductoisomerase [Pirellulaceae bacterium]